MPLKLSDTCCHKDFGQTLPALKIESNNYWEVPMFTEEAPALLLLWQRRNDTICHYGPAHRSCLLANKSLFKSQCFCLLHYYYPDKLLCALFPFALTCFNCAESWRSS